MDMNRRTVLLGLGATGIGTGALFGSGAFTSVQASRDFTVEVAGDEAAALGLIANDDLEGVTNDAGTGDGRFAIQLDNINEESTLLLGDVDDADPEAFTVSNQTGDADFSDGFTLDVTLETKPAEATLYETDTQGGTTGEWTEGSSLTLADGEEHFVAIEVDLAEADVGGEDAITFLAERNTA